MRAASASRSSDMKVNRSRRRALASLVNVSSAVGVTETSNIIGHLRLAADLFYGVQRHYRTSRAHDHCHPEWYAANDLDWNSRPDPSRRTAQHDRRRVGHQDDCPSAI